MKAYILRLESLFKSLQSITPNGYYYIDKYIQQLKQVLSKMEQTGGSKVYVLGRDRKVVKVGRKSMITYKGKQISLTEARALEKKLTAEKKKMVAAKKDKKSSKKKATKKPAKTAASKKKVVRKTSAK